MVRRVSSFAEPLVLVLLACLDRRDLPLDGVEHLDQGRGNALERDVDRVTLAPYRDPVGSHSRRQVEAPFVRR